jgi:hypothetical protein
MHLMASAEGEAERTLSDQEHVSGCPACQQWLRDFATVTAEIQELPYPHMQQDLWPGIKEQIQRGSHTPLLARKLWPIGLMAIVWRTLQLSTDLPVPELSSFVPLAAAVLVVWRVGRDLLVIETWAPELHKRGI